MANGDIEVTIKPADWLTVEIMRQIQRQALCPYCHVGRPLVDNSVSYVAVDERQLVFNSDKFVGNDETESVRIRNCPMCGRKLEADDESDD